MSESSSQRERVILLYTGFVALFALGVLLNLSRGLFVAPDLPMTADSQTSMPLDEHGFSESVHIVRTLNDWKSLLQSGRHILFIDCDWNVAMVAFRRPFSAFADWCHEETNYRSASVKMIAYPDDELSTAAKLSTAAQELMRSNEIFQGGLKTYGGAGRIIWLEDGRVLDYEWCHEFLNDSSKLKVRSRKAFQ